MESSKGAGRLVANLASMSAEMTKELNQIAKYYRKPYREFIDRLSDVYGDSGFWWDTPLSSRNDMSLCFQNICKLRVALNLAEREGVDRFIVDGRTMGRAILENTDGIMARVAGQTGFGADIAIREEHGERSRQVFSWFKDWIRGLCEHRRDSDLLRFEGREIALVGTYRIVSEEQNGILVDRYFPGLIENTDENIVFLSMFHVSDEDYRPLVDAVHDRRDHICIEDWIAKEDLEEIERYIQWSRSVDVPPCEFDGMQVGTLVETDLRVGSWNINAMYGIARGEALCRLVGKHGLHVKCFIDWYEGQPSSNAAIRRFRAKYPEIPTIAYVPSPIGENNLSMCPSPRQEESKVVPEYYGMPGKAWEDFFHRLNEDVRTIKAPSFRNQHVFAANMEIPEKRSGILLMLSYWTDCSAQLLEAFGNAIQEMNNIDIDHIYIKNHPVNSSMKIRDYGVAESLYENFGVDYLTCSFAEAVHGKEIVILVKTTSTMEVVLSGASTINFIPEGELSFVAVPEYMTQAVSVAYNADDIRRCLQRKRDGLSAAMARKIRDDVFVRTSRDTVGSFILAGES